MKGGHVLAVVVVIGLACVYCLPFVCGEEELTTAEMVQLHGGECEGCAYSEHLCDRVPWIGCLAVMGEVCWDNQGIPPFTCGPSNSETGPWSICYGVGEDECEPGNLRYCLVRHECEPEWIPDTCPWDYDVWGYWACFDGGILPGVVTGPVGACE